MTYPNLANFTSDMSLLLASLLTFGAAWYAFMKLKEAL